jgi:HlyD family secretion protein
MNKLLTIIKKKAVYIPLGIIVLIVAGVSIYGATHKPVYQTAKAEKKDFIVEVSATGKVVAANDVELGFESGGKVANIPVKVGQEVKKGALLASVGSGQLYASLLAERARLAEAQIDLDEVLRGTRETELRNIENDYEQSQRDLEASIQESFSKSDDTLQIYIDVLFRDPASASPRFVESSADSRDENLEHLRVEAGDMIKAWRKSLDTLDTEGYNDNYRKEADTNLKFMRSFLDQLATASARFPQSQTMTDADRAAYTEAITSGRANINAAIASFNTSYQSYIRAKGDYDLAKEGSTSEEIRRAQSAVDIANANVLRASSALAETSIIAPFDGIVTKIDLRVGQLVSSQTPVVSMISNSNFEIESYIPEADIAKIQVGDVGTTTLDAYGDDVKFSVIVTAIDLSETEVDGVSTYKTTLQFDTADERIRSGMTANIDLLSETLTGILSVPQTAVVNKESKRNVMLMKENGKTETKEVKTGMLDSNGNIEIKEGLSEGDTVVTNPVKK